ncbi:ABC-2 type transporter-domain-containing protein [Penicillium bovifimosum]|uniref:ABC-2 type transporter-domain-containing protein n=1 Tax=Penicillium bovifimosum TaxID=126998 RepID=A0A9W9GHU2_9EURO|nr:ABC-2 type transporter-domain-containing protein [Penicillium bovifimosum]KAJ5120753.1 ABC-2 type transporter-domain-containing protein [Penicillium bovifimosum]
MRSQFRGEAIDTAETDVHFPQLSVGDTLNFAAMARAPRNRLPGVSRDQYAEHMRDVVMAMLGCLAERSFPRQNAKPLIAAFRNSTDKIVTNPGVHGVGRTQHSDDDIRMCSAYWSRETPGKRLRGARAIAANFRVSPTESWGKCTSVSAV